MVIHTTSWLMFNSCCHQWPSPKFPYRAGYEHHGTNTSKPIQGQLDGTHNMWGLFTGCVVLPRDLEWKIQNIHRSIWQTGLTCSLSWRTAYIQQTTLSGLNHCQNVSDYFPWIKSCVNKTDYFCWVEAVSKSNRLLLLSQNELFI